MTSKPQKRRSELIQILSDMSKNWSRWTSADWGPLEDELSMIEEQEDKRRRRGCTTA